MKELLCKAAGVDSYSRYLIEKIDSIDEKLLTEKNPSQRLALIELKKTYQNAREVYDCYKTNCINKYKKNESSLSTD